MSSKNIFVSFMNIALKNRTYENNYKLKLVERCKISNPLISVICIAQLIYLFIKTIQGKETETGFSFTLGIFFTMIIIFVILVGEIVVIFFQILLSKNNKIQRIVSFMNYFIFFFNAYLLKKLLLNAYRLDGEIIKMIIFISFLLQTICILLELIDFNGVLVCNISFIILTAIINTTVQNWWEDDIWNTIMNDVFQISLIGFSFLTMRNSRILYYNDQSLEEYNSTNETISEIIHYGMMKIIDDKITYINKYACDFLLKSGAIRSEDLIKDNYSVIGEKTRHILMTLYKDINCDDVEQMRKNSKDNGNSIRNEQQTDCIVLNIESQPDNQPQPTKVYINNITEENQLSPIENFKKKLKNYSSLFTYLGRGKLKQEIPNKERDFFFEVHGRKNFDGQQDSYEFLIKESYLDQMFTEKKEEILKEKNEEIKTITVGLSKYVHEFKTPLICIQGILNSDKKTEDESRDMITGLCEYLITLALNLDVFTKQYLFKIGNNVSCSPPITNTFDIADTFKFIKIIANTLIERYDKKNSLKFHIDYQKLPRTINTYEMKLKQVLINLISNAIKFTVKGKIKLSVIRDNDNCDDLKFIVSDTGDGIPEGAQKNLFKLFSNAKKEGKNNQTGAGLGLSITEHMAKELGRGLQFKSELNKGSSFWFYVNAPDDDSESYESTSTVLAPKDRFLESEIQIQSINSLESKMLKKWNIMICDDEHMTRNSAKKTFLEYGKKHNHNINIIEECDGFTALAKIFELHYLKKSEETIDFIISDENMNGLNGTQTVQELRKFEEKNHLKPVLYFLPLDLENKESFNNGLIDGYFHKPLTCDELDKLFNVYNEKNLKSETQSFNLPLNVTLSSKND